MVNLFTLHVITMHNDLVNLMGNHLLLCFCSKSKVSHRERSTHYANTVLIDGLYSVIRNVNNGNFYGELLKSQICLEHVPQFP